MNNQQRDFIAKAAAAAKEGGHVFPDMAACEAALESAYGNSGLAVKDNNLFGMKQHLHPTYGTHVLPTKEFENGHWITINASWVHYPAWSDCFVDRMRTLNRLAPAKGFEHYAAALAAQDPETYVREISAKWSTDPLRAEKVITIYRACQANAASGS
jgi:flagellum-specific peptidoglycan hydrolase FlgJ